VTDILVWQRPPKFCVKVGCYYFATQLVLLSQKVATNDEENHLFGKIHTSAMGGWNGSAKIE